MADVSDMHNGPDSQLPTKERVDFFAGLSPVEAVRIFIEAGFSISTEEALILAAIRRDPRVRASDSAVIMCLLDGGDDRKEPADILEDLAALKPAPETKPGASRRSEKAYKIPPGLIGKVGKRRR